MTVDVSKPFLGQLRDQEAVSLIPVVRKMDSSAIISDNVPIARMRAQDINRSISIVSQGSIAKLQSKGEFDEFLSSPDWKFGVVWLAEFAVHFQGNELTRAKY